MKIKNVSNEKVVTMTNGQVIEFEPHGQEGSVKDVWDPVFCRHILTTYRDFGIVHWEYNGEMQKKYESRGGQQAFEKDQIIDACKHLKNKWQETLTFERQAMKAAKDQREDYNMSAKRFEDKIKEVEEHEKALLASYKPKEPVKEQQSYSDETTAPRRGRPPLDKTLNAQG